MAFKAPALRVLKSWLRLGLSPWLRLQVKNSTWLDNRLPSLSSHPLRSLGCSFSPTLSRSPCVSLPLSPSLSSTRALFWLTGPAVKVSQEHAPHPRPEWKLAQVAVRARPGKMKEGGCGGCWGRGSSVCAHSGLCLCLYGWLAPRAPTTWALYVSTSAASSLSFSFPQTTLQFNYSSKPQNWAITSVKMFKLSVVVSTLLCLLITTPQVALR